MRLFRIGLNLSVALASALALSGAGAMAQTQPPAAGPTIGDLLEGPAPEPAPKAAPPKPVAKSPDVDADAVSDKPPPKTVVAQPAKRVKRPAAIIQALDKVTAETLRFEADLNQPVRYKDLVFTVHDCEESASDEPQPGAFANLEIDSQPKPPPGQTAPPARQLFKGWMFSNAPGPHPFEHPVYDAWLIACKAASAP